MILKVFAVWCLLTSFVPERCTTRKAFLSCDSCSTSLSSCLETPIPNVSRNSPDNIILIRFSSNYFVISNTVSQIEATSRLSRFRAISMSQYDLCPTYKHMSVGFLVFLSSPQKSKSIPLFHRRSASLSPCRHRPRQHIMTFSSFFAEHHGCSMVLFFIQLTVKKRSKYINLVQV